MSQGPPDPGQRPVVEQPQGVNGGQNFGPQYPPMQGHPNYYQGEYLQMLQFALIWLAEFLTMRFYMFFTLIAIWSIKILRF